MAIKHYLFVFFISGSCFVMATNEESTLRRRRASIKPAASAPASPAQAPASLASAPASPAQAPASLASAPASPAPAQAAAQTPSKWMGFVHNFLAALEQD